jgi:transcription elongation factor
MKYIVETLGIFRMVHVVEAENKDEAFRIAQAADDNWQEHLGEMRVDICEYTEEQIAHFRKKQYFSDHVSFKDENGVLSYLHPNGEVVPYK